MNRGKGQRGRGIGQPFRGRGRGFVGRGRGGGSSFGQTSGRGGGSHSAQTRRRGSGGSSAQRGGRGGSVGPANITLKAQGQSGQPPSELCITCKQKGHDFTQCTYACAYCREIHNGQRCPRGEAAGRYPPVPRPRFTEEEEQDMLMNLRGVLENLKRECADLEARDRLLRSIQVQHGIDPDAPFAHLPPQRRRALLLYQQPSSETDSIGSSLLAPPVAATGGSGGDSMAPPQGGRQRIPLNDLEVPGWDEKYDITGLPEKQGRGYRKNYKKRKLDFVRENGYSYLLDSRENEEMLGVEQPEQGGEDAMGVVGEENEDTAMSGTGGPRGGIGAVEGLSLMLSNLGSMQ